MRSREAMMAGKYSAEWWEKIADINREISARHDPSSVVDDLIQATANGRPSPMTKSETPLRGAGFQGGETAPGWSQFKFCRSSRRVVGWGHTGPEGLPLAGVGQIRATLTPKPAVYYVGCSSRNSQPRRSAGLFLTGASRLTAGECCFDILP
jgi:hypothetical protein